MEEELEVKILNSGFYELLCDASFTFYCCSKAESRFEQNRFARASILSTVLSIESLSNVLLSILELSKATRNDFDKLPVLAKFDSYLLTRHHKTMDRGRVEIGKIQDLVNLRNSFVHPKPGTGKTKAHFSGLSAEQTRDAPEYDIHLSPQKYGNVNILKESNLWAVQDAKECLIAASNFINYFLSFLERDEIETIKGNLATTIEPFGVRMVTEEIYSELSRLETIGVDFTEIIYR